jgi:hypothetical protein
MRVDFAAGAEDGNGEGHPEDDPAGVVAVDALVQPHPDPPSAERAGQADEEQREDGARCHPSRS